MAESSRVSEPRKGISGLNILIVAEHASAKFGGEAILPLHYFRFLSQRGESVWLFVHERTRAELQSILSSDEFGRVRFVRDTVLHRFIWKIGSKLPPRAKALLCDAPMHLLTQMLQRRRVGRIISDLQIDIVHEPMPVSPRQPSAMFALGVPVLIGPMNGGMTYPPGLRASEGRVDRAFRFLADNLSDIANFTIPGKKFARLLLVANERTRLALPKTATNNVQIMCENGIDYAIWSGSESHAPSHSKDHTCFLFMGRLVTLKAVNVIIEALALVQQAGYKVSLVILGDGPCRPELERLVADRNCKSIVEFMGFLPQADCAAILSRCDVLLMPSVKECGGAVVLEAMAMAKPVIATAWGGPVDYLSKGGGLLVEPGSYRDMESQFAERMKELASCPDLRIQLGRKGQAIAKDEFDWSAKIDKIIDIYKDLCQSD